MQVGVGGINFSGKKHYEGVILLAFTKKALHNT